MILAASQSNISRLSAVAIFIPAIKIIRRVFRNRNVDLGNVRDEALNTKKNSFSHWTVSTVKLTNTQIQINNSRHVETRLKAIYSND